ncbi:MAG TPA: tRNA (adenosine(37)-N6)-threonylcarbamoyltransferase complex dimerization subunit type 1 TsaB [Verrucomicrobiae bacterium]|nr:tRNA (adenosine(37)-N6)-threonylcarbamoyltransferase complex dimerization subunit type 1 TsaB [Verrucomicrobiae bacterium]
MITLAIDTSTRRGAVALLREDQPLAEETFDRTAPGQNLFDTAGKLLSGNRLTAKDIGLLAVGLGPGSFTGIRAGIAAAKGLAFPGQLPSKGVSSFDAVALTALPKMPRDCPQMCVLCDARRDEVYFALYDRDGRPASPCRIEALEAIADQIHHPIWFVSPEMERFQHDLALLFGGFASICETPVFPGAAALGWQAVQQFHADGDRGDDRLEPIYLRAPQYKTI